MTILLLLACATDPAELPCREGFARAADGHCYPPAPVATGFDFEAALGSLDACEPLLDGVSADLESGCAYFLCPGDSFEEAVDVLGEAYTCRAASGDAYCLWEHIGVEGRWDDDDGDGLPDDDADNQRVHLTEGSLAATPDGLGVGVPLSCFVAALGSPDSMNLVDTVDGLVIDTMDWDDAGLLVYDLYDRNGFPGPDQRADELYLYGAP